MRNTQQRRGSGKKIRVGFVGCGIHASLTIFKCLTYAPIELVGVCDIDTARRERNARLYGARAYASVDEMLKRETIDAVFIVGPFEMHYTVGKKCLAAGKHVWMEKPPGVSTKQAKELAELADENELICQVGTYMRFAPAYQMAKEITERGEFGRLHAVDIRFMTQGYPDLKTFLLAHSIHAADLLLFFAGEVRKTFVRRSQEHKGLLSLQCSQEHARGTISVVHMSALQSWGSPNARVELTGVGKHVIVENAAKLTYYRGGHVRPMVDFKKPGWLDLRHAPLDEKRDALTWEPNQSWAMVYSYRGYEDEIAHFATSVLVRHQPQASIRDALAAMKLVEAWEISLKRKKEVRVK
jgi:predicted dehydrogenase